MEKKVILGEKVKTNLIDRADAKVCQTTFFKQIFFFNKKNLEKYADSCLVLRVYLFDGHL